MTNINKRHFVKRLDRNKSERIRADINFSNENFSSNYSIGHLVVIVNYSIEREEYFHSIGSDRAFQAGYMSDLQRFFAFAFTLSF